VKTGGSWSTEVVDTASTDYRGTSIALDALGTPHIAYIEATLANLWYASKTGVSWNKEHLVKVGLGTLFVNVEPSLALDAQGTPHISYHDDFDADLEYAVRTGGSWSFEQVDTEQSAGMASSLALDAQGNPHISYAMFNGLYYSVKYADATFRLTSPTGGETWASSEQATVTWEAAGLIDIEASPDAGATYVTLLRNVSGGTAVVSVPAWTTTTARVRITRTDPFASHESPDVFTIALQKVTGWWQSTVDEVGNVGPHTSLALDAQGRPHVSYGDNSSFVVKYAMKTGGAWMTEVVDATGTLGVYTAIAVDAQSNPHVSYWDLTNSDLKYAERTGGSWMTEIVDAAGAVGTYSSIAVDAQGAPHISYSDDTNQNLKYAEKTAGSWNIEIVDATGSVGIHTSIVLDGQDEPHISYFDGTNLDLKYATKTGPFWISERVDTTGSVGFFTSIALDTQGAPHIAYYDNTNDDLKYAVKTGSGWSIETVDAGGDVGTAASIALDVDGNPRIAYYDNTDDDLEFAVKAGGVWSFETVDAAGNVGLLYTSVDVDVRGDPRIAYYDVTNGDLKYAAAGLDVTVPVGGDVWAVGALRTIRWDGLGTVDVSLSVDGGATYPFVLGTDIAGSSVAFLVPHTPSRFCRVLIKRGVEANTFGSWCYPHAIAESGSLFTIETTVELLLMTAAPPAQGSGLVVSWRTDPGPEDLNGYRLEKRRPEEAWFTLASQTTETEYHDADGRSGDRYRLFAINGLGDALFLAETGADEVPSLTRDIAAYPVPFQGGELTILFGNVTSAGQFETKVTIYDALGRRVRTVARKRFRGTVGQVTWDGRGARGGLVSSGVYFVRVEDARGSLKKIIVVR
jgi:hypothetical protein